MDAGLPSSRISGISLREFGYTRLVASCLLEKQERNVRIPFSGERFVNLTKLPAWYGYLGAAESPQLASERPVFNRIGLDPTLRNALLTGQVTLYIESAHQIAGSRCILGPVVGETGRRFPSP